MIHIDIFDASGNVVAKNVTDFLSLDCARSKNSVGSFEVVLPSTYDWIDFQRDFIVEIWRTHGRTPKLIGETCWFVRKVVIEQGARRILGHDTMGLLQRRSVVAWDTKSSEVSGANNDGYKTAPADVAISEVFLENFVNVNRDDIPPSAGGDVDYAYADTIIQHTAQTGGIPVGYQITGDDIVFVAPNEVHDVDGEMGLFQDGQIVNISGTTSNNGLRTIQTGPDGEKVTYTAGTIYFEASDDIYDTASGFENFREGHIIKLSGSGVSLNAGFHYPDNVSVNSMATAGLFGDLMVDEDLRPNTVTIEQGHKFTIATNSIIEEEPATATITMIAWKARQKFTPAESFYTANISVKLAKIGEPGDSVKVSILNSSDTELWSDTIAAADILTTLSWHELEGVVELIQGQEYKLVIERTGVDTESYYLAGVDANAQFTNGQFQVHDGSGWIDWTASMVFRINSEPINPSRIYRPYRAMPIEHIPPLGSAPVVESAVAKKTALAAMNEIVNAAEAEDHDIWFDILYESGGNSLGTFEFIIWNGERGSDLTWGIANNPVVLSESYGNVEIAKLEINYEDEINWVHVTGSGQGRLQIFYPVVDTDNFSASPFYPIEKIEQAGDIQSESALESFGRGVIAENKPRTKIEGTLIESEGTLFGYDFNYGDAISVAHAGVTYRSLVDQFRLAASGGIEDVSIPISGEKII